MQLCNYMQLGTGTFFKIRLDFLLFFYILTAVNANSCKKGACPQLRIVKKVPDSCKKGACPQLHLRCLIEYNEEKFR